LFQAENVFVEVELQLFVAKVDAQLLEAVLFEGLKPENVEHADDVRVAGSGLGPVGCGRSRIGRGGGGHDNKYKRENNESNNNNNNNNNKTKL
jgi:hypothetical protein